MGYSFTLTLFNKLATLVHIFFQAAVLLLLIVPIITMRLLAEERRTGTLELLLTAPVRESHVVLAKFLASMAVVAAMIGLDRRLRGRARPVRRARTGARSTAAISAWRCSAARWSRSGSRSPALTVQPGGRRDRRDRPVPPAWMLDTLAAMLPDAARRGLHQPVAAGALHAVRDRRDVHLGLRLLHQHRPCSRCSSPCARWRAAEHGARRLDAGRSGLVRSAGWSPSRVLFPGRLRLPLQTRLGALRRAALRRRGRRRGVAVAVLANVALSLHDAHIDLTREKIYTPSAQAMKVVDDLEQPVRLTYFYRGQDPDGRRAADVLDVMARRNPLLQVRVVDPDKQPTLAAPSACASTTPPCSRPTAAARWSRPIDESEIAIGIQRVLREKVVTVCFLEGHNELPMDNFEFHTHVEGVASHSHDDARPAVIMTTGHGIGRLRRALEGQGYEVRKVVLATQPAVPPDCPVAIVANPRTTFLPAESAALERYLQQGGCAARDVRSRLRARARARRAAADARRAAFRRRRSSTRSATTRPTGDGRGHRLRAAPDHAQPVDDVLPRRPPAGLVPPAAGIQVTPLFSSSADSYTRRSPRSPNVSPRPRWSPTRPARRFAPGRASSPPRSKARLPAARRPPVPRDRDRRQRFREQLVPAVPGQQRSRARHGPLAAARGARRDRLADPGAAARPAVEGADARVFLILVVLLPLAVFALGSLIWWRRR